MIIIGARKTIYINMEEAKGGYSVGVFEVSGAERVSPWEEVAICEGG
jgi:hypothetical protein